MSPGSNSAQDPCDGTVAATMFRGFVRELGPVAAKSLLDGLTRSLAEGWPGITVTDEHDLAYFTADEANVTFRYFGFHTLSVPQALVIVEEELNARRR